MNHIRTIMYICLFIVFGGRAFCQSHFDTIPKGDRGMKTGPEIGSKISDFKLPDQFGALRDFSSIAGPNGAVILFHRSADW